MGKRQRVEVVRGPYCSGALGPLWAMCRSYAVITVCVCCFCIQSYKEECRLLLGSVALVSIVYKSFRGI
jgi:hypothetical protein